MSTGTTPREVGSNLGLGVLPAGLTVLAFDAGGGVRIEAAKQLNGRTLWAVRSNSEVFGKGGDWEYEPLPSNRTDAFIERCRFATPIEAFACLQMARLNA